ncbi:DUF4397 domain-containing protein [Niabella terrae]
MKTNILFSAILGTSLLIGLGSCSKMLDNPDYDNTLNDAAAVSVVHASPGLSTLDVALDDNRLGVNYFNYTDRVDYFRAYPGSRKFKVFHASAASSNPVFSKDLNFEVGKYYSVFIVDTAAKMDAVSVRDSTRAAGRDSVRLRLVNMSPDAPGLDLYVKGETTPIVSNITYKKAGNFISFLSAGNLVFEIKRTGTNQLLATSETMNLYEGFIYTLWTGGYIGGNEAKGTRIKLDAYRH